MIEKYYAAHIKNRLDAAAINVMKSKHHKPKHLDHPKPRHDGERHTEE